MKNETFLLKTGAERTELYLPFLKDKRVALLVNQTSVLRNPSVHLSDTLLSLGIEVKKIFVPEHGFRGKADAGERVGNGKDTHTGLPIVSLYGKNKKPSSAQLQDVDVLVFDLQDVGARFYTYISTMAYAMEACAENRKEFIVLDRPNPCDYVDGPVLQADFRSFVGMFSIPVLHGCTVGELARMIRGEGWIKQADELSLTVIPVEGWKHGQPYSLPQKPSPNLPNDRSIAFYPSLCPFEATSVSIGRGTTFPFQVIGGTDPAYGKFSFVPRSLPGWEKNPVNKDKTCYGVDLRDSLPPHGFTLKYFIDFYRRSALGKAFFSNPRWFDLLMGTATVREAILAGKSEEEIRAAWQPPLSAYRKIRENYLLY